MKHEMQLSRNMTNQTIQERNNPLELKLSLDSKNNVQYASNSGLQNVMTNRITELSETNYKKTETAEKRREETQTTTKNLKRNFD